NKTVLLQTRCPFTSLVISNIETTFLPSNTASSLSSARMLRLSLGSWSSCLRMYSQSFLVGSVRGSGSLPSTAASAASGCAGLLRAFLVVAAFFGVGIGQLERAGLGSQAKNQPCFSGSRERLGDSQLLGSSDCCVHCSKTIRISRSSLANVLLREWATGPRSIFLVASTAPKVLISRRRNPHRIATGSRTSALLSFDESFAKRLHT